jgi:flagellin-like protein
LRKLIKNQKALSPVVASIILIAVTVAVSIAIAAWMGALTFSFTSNEYSIQIIEAEFLTPNLISLTIKNNGTGSMKLTDVYINDQHQAITQPSLYDQPLLLDAGSIVRLNVTYAWIPKYNYQFKFSVTSGSKNYYYFVDIIAPAE